MYNYRHFFYFSFLSRHLFCLKLSLEEEHSVCVNSRKLGILISSSIARYLKILRDEEIQRMHICFFRDFIFVKYY